MTLPLLGAAILALFNMRNAEAFTMTPARFPAAASRRAKSVLEPTTTRLTTSSSSSTQLYANAGAMKCRPIGIGSAVPHTVITNQDLEQVVETNDEWIQTRTGIAQRHVLIQGQDLRELAVRASQNALDMAGLTAADLDLVICCTSTPDDMFGAAPRIAADLGCPTTTVAFDLTAACSGFMFGIATAGQFLSNSGNQKCLVIGADALSRWVDWDDRNTCILFGDGAGAMVLESSDEAGVLGYAAHSNGKGWCDLQLE